MNSSSRNSANPLFLLVFMAIGLISCRGTDYAKTHNTDVDRSYLLKASQQAEQMTGLPPHNGGANKPPVTKTKEIK